LTDNAFFFISATIVNGGNYLFNLFLGRWLGPAAFADVSLIITLFLVVTFVTTGLQQAAAKFAAMYSADGNESQMAGLWRWLGFGGWGLGGIAFLILAVGTPFWQQFFNTQSFWPFVLFGIGVSFYFVQGIDSNPLLVAQPNYPNFVWQCLSLRCAVALALCCGHRALCIG